MTPDGITRHVRAGDIVVVGRVLGEPTALVEELIRQVAQLDGTRLFVGMSVSDLA
jgi:hypothetical protein